MGYSNSSFTFNNSRFFSDIIGFILLIPFTRKILINIFVKKKQNLQEDDNTVDGEIIEDKKDEL